MKKALGYIVVSGLASTAFAQTGSLSITASAASVDTTSEAPSVTLFVWGDADFGAAIAGGGFALSALGGDGFITDMVAAGTAWGALGFQDNGYAGAGNHNGMIFGQLIFPPFIAPHADSLLGASPVLLGSFVVSIAQNAQGIVDISTAALGENFVLEIYTDDGADGTFTQLTGADISHGSISIFTPAPSALALLGFGGLAAGRRRR